MSFKSSILFRTGGGLGKQIIATGVAKAIKESNPDSVLHVQTSYPEAFSGLDFVDKYFPYDRIPYFYDEHKDFEVMEVEPYMHLGYRNGSTSIMEAWCEKLGVQSVVDKGIVKLDEEELEVGKRFVGDTTKEKDLVAVQFFGGTSYFSPQEADNPLRPLHYRSLRKDIAQEIVNKLIELGYVPVQIGLPTEPKLEGAAQLSSTDVVNPRFVMSILNQCKFAICIDSFVQHAWAAMGKEKAIVLWGGTNPKSLGYESNVNMVNKGSCSTPHCNRPNTFLFDFRGNGSPWKCVLNGRCMGFKSEEVIESFKSVAGIEEKEKSKSKKAKSEVKLGKPEDLK